MKIDLTSLINAVCQLEQGLSAHAKEPQNELMRDGVIQRFEYTYELCHKMLKRYLEATEPNPAIIDELSFSDLIRTGAEKGLLLRSWDHWISYRTARGTTSHTYDSKKAEGVFAVIPAFLEDARFLRDRLVERQG